MIRCQSAVPAPKQNLPSTRKKTAEDFKKEIINANRLCYIRSPCFDPAGSVRCPGRAICDEKIACRALEVHTDDELKVTVVVFLQRDEGQRSQLAALLREYSGAMVEVQTGNGAWWRARLLRLKSSLRPWPAAFANASALSRAQRIPPALGAVGQGQLCSKAQRREFPPGVTYPAYATHSALAAECVGVDDCGQRGTQI